MGLMLWAALGACIGAVWGQDVHGMVVGAVVAAGLYVVMVLWESYPGHRRQMRKIQRHERRQGR